MSKDFRVPQNIFSDPNYYHYIVQYEGNIEEEVSKQPGFYVTIVNDKYAIISTVNDIQINIEGPKFSTIAYVALPQFFTLQDISPIEASGAGFLQLNLPLRLTGEGVTIAIIDTGIDYLNDEFIKENGETKIEYIWDQTIVSEGENSKSQEVPFGVLYNKNDIQKAINAFKSGNSPYDIVKTVDNIGHGTNMAGIIGAIGKNAKLKGLVPDCNFIVVKLIEAISFKKLYDINITVYDIVSIFPALEFLYRYSLNNNKPLVIYFPLGSNFGSHRGNGVLEQYMDSISRNSGIAIVSGAGNQGASETHASGAITQVNEERVLQLYISPEQKYTVIEIWIDTPNIMSLSIISPSGESTETINAEINALKTYSFVFENTLAKINYYIPEESTGDELIRIRFFNLKEGVWRFKLTGKVILDGKYNAWIPQLGISTGGTRFISSDPYGTIMNPSTSSYIITAAAYNQNSNTILSYSGMSLLDDYLDRIDVAAGGVNALTTAPNNKTAVVNGTSVSAAVLAGACAMLFQWGIVEGNYPSIYSQTIKTYISRGAVKRSGDSYPNPQWGYGMLNILKMFQNML